MQPAPTQILRRTRNSNSQNIHQVSIIKCLNISYNKLKPKLYVLFLFQIQVKAEPDEPEHAESEAGPVQVAPEADPAEAALPGGDPEAEQQRHQQLGGQEQPRHRHRQLQEERDLVHQEEH